jgi:hypothetical protein
VVDVTAVVEGVSVGHHIFAAGTSRAAIPLLPPIDE